MANQWANQAKIGLELRLDPCHLPQNVVYVSKKTGTVMTCSLSERGASLRKEADGDVLSLSHLILTHQFKGIAARAVETVSGDRAVSLELLHDDDDACIPLLVSRDLDDVLLDWRLWSDTYDLPMLMIGEDHIIMPVRERTSLQYLFGSTPIVKAPPRFLLRCRGASLGVRLVISNQVMLG